MYNFFSCYTWSAVYKGHMMDVKMLHRDFSDGHERYGHPRPPLHFIALNKTPTIFIFVFIQIISMNSFPNHH